MSTELNWNPFKYQFKITTRTYDRLVDGQLPMNCWCHSGANTLRGWERISGCEGVSFCWAWASSDLSWRILRLQFFFFFNCAELSTKNKATCGWVRDRHSRLSGRVWRNQPPRFPFFTQMHSPILFSRWLPFWSLGSLWTETYCVLISFITQATCRILEGFYWLSLK